jgi:hypothetical protein
VIAASPPRAAEALSIPMSDGTMLAALRLPAPRSPAPAVVMLTPYGKERWIEQAGARFGLGSLGCELVVADVRGLGGSGGDWDGPLSPREIDDGVELLAWIAARGFCDGRTALVGPSYMGANTLLIAARRPSSLRCAIAVVAPVDAYRDMWRRGGIPSHMSWAIATAFANEHRPGTQERVLRDFYLKAMAESLESERHRSRSAEGSIGAIDVPVLLVGGWYDQFLRATVRAFEGLRAPRRLVIGSWGHRIDDPRLADESARWLAHWLDDRTASDPSAAPNVVLQCVGSGEWASHDRWPSAGEIAFERWRPISSNAPVPISLGLDPAATTIPPIAPAEALANGSGMYVWREAWTADGAAVGTHARYRGPVALRLALTSTSAADLDAHARLSVVSTDGTAHQLTEGRLRASHRAVDHARSQRASSGELVVPWHPHDHAEPIERGEPVVLDIEFFPINVELAPGESLQLGVTLVRADEVVAPAEARLLPETYLLLPRADR